MTPCWHGRTAPGPPRDWHEHPLVGGGRKRRRLRPGWAFTAGTVLGLVIGVLAR